jgi:hypothetical protein
VVKISKVSRYASLLPVVKMSPPANRAGQTEVTMNTDNVALETLAGRLDGMTLVMLKVLRQLHVAGLMDAQRLPADLRCAADAIDPKTARLAGRADSLRDWARLIDESFDEWMRGHAMLLRALEGMQSSPYPEDYVAPRPREPGSQPAPRKPRKTPRSQG